MKDLEADAVVLAVSASSSHSMHKRPQESIHLLADLGVVGDAHLGATVQHRSRVVRDPSLPNLRQVHLLHSELLVDLRRQGFFLEPGQVGENVTTRGLDLLALPRGTRLRLGAEAVVEVTGLRNPCVQLDGVQAGLMAAMLGRDEQGELVRKAGIMAVVRRSGKVRPGDSIRVVLPPPPHLRLQPV